MTAPRWIRVPAEDPLAAHRIAGLTALETAIVLTARALVMTCPDVSRVARPCDSAELRTARDLIDDCERLCVALDAHRLEIQRHLHDNLVDDRPF